MALTICRDLQLCLRLGAPDLASRALLSRFLLSLFGARQHLTPGDNRRFTLGDARLDVLRAEGKRLDAAVRRRLALGQSFDQRAGFRCLAAGALMLSARARSTIGGLGVGACRKGGGFLGDN